MLSFIGNVLSQLAKGLVTKTAITIEPMYTIIDKAVFKKPLKTP